MNVFGIPFTHRRPSNERELVARDFAQFTAFASLAESKEVARFVRGVFYDTNSQCFHIDMNERFEDSDAGDEVARCADATLSQYELFGTIGGKS